MRSIWNKKSFKRISLMIFIIGVSSGTIAMVSVNASASAVDKVPSMRGLTLLPVRNEIAIAPGTSQSGSLNLVNDSDESIIVHMSSEKFSVVNQSYDYSFSAEPAISKWVTFSQNEVSLQPRKSQKVTFMIGVPLSAEPRGRYISLFATSDIKTDDGQIKSQQRIASLVYLTVTGDVKRMGELLSLSSPWLITNTTNSWDMILRDNGSTHFRSRYSVKLEDIIGGGATASSSGDALILPGTPRLITGTVPTPRIPGIYKVVYTIGLGDTPAIHQTRYLLYLPAWSVTAFFIFAMLVTMTFFYIRSFRKR